MSELDLSKLLKEMGVDMASLEKLANIMKDNPEMKRLFEHKLKDKGFEKSIDEMYNELNEVFNHGKSPNVR